MRFLVLVAFAGLLGGCASIDGAEEPGIAEGQPPDEVADPQTTGPWDGIDGWEVGSVSGYDPGTQERFVEFSGGGFIANATNVTYEAYILERGCPERERPIAPWATKVIPLGSFGEVPSRAEVAGRLAARDLPSPLNEVQFYSLLAQGDDIGASWCVPQSLI